MPRRHIRHHRHSWTKSVSPIDLHERSCHLRDKAFLVSAPWMITPGSLRVQAVLPCQGIVPWGLQKRCKVRQTSTRPNEMRNTRFIWPISIIVFLSAVKWACDTNAVREDNSFWLLHFFMKHPAAAGSTTASHFYLICKASGGRYSHFFLWSWKLFARDVCHRWFYCRYRRLHDTIYATTAQVVHRMYPSSWKIAFRWGGIYD